MRPDTVRESNCEEEKEKEEEEASLPPVPAWLSALNSEELRWSEGINLTEGDTYPESRERMPKDEKAKKRFQLQTSFDNKWLITSNQWQKWHSLEQFNESK